MKFYVSCSQNAAFINAVETEERIADVVNWHLLGEWETREAVLEERFPKGLFDENGCGNYKRSEGVIVERTQEEKEAELAARPAPLPSLEEQVKANSAAILAIMMGGMPSV